jgi:hypothetical protein
MRVHRASGNDIPLAVLNNQSLNQVFVGGQLVTNGDFDGNNITGWGAILGTVAGVNNSLEVTVTGLSSTSHYAHFRFDRFANNVYYSNIRINAPYNNLFSFYDGNVFRFYGSPTPNQWTQLSIQFTQPATRLATDNINLHRFRIPTDTNYSVGDKWFLDDVYFINLTALGIDTLTQSQLDYLFTVWQFNQVNALVARQFIQEA